MKTCGYDWLFIDLEHNSMDIDMATQISMAAQDTGITPIVRVPDFAHHHATRVLDCGSQGIVFPHVDDKETAERLVSNCLFPPKGHRSMTGLLPQLDFKKYNGILKNRNLISNLKHKKISNEIEKAFSYHYKENTISILKKLNIESFVFEKF